MGMRRLTTPRGWVTVYLGLREAARDRARRTFHPAMMIGERTGCLKFPDDFFGRKLGF
jgi:hypothetical protein